MQLIGRMDWTTMQLQGTSSIALWSSVLCGWTLEHIAQQSLPHSPVTVVARGHKGIATSNKGITTSSYLLLVVMPGVPSSVLVPSSNALCY